MFDVNRRGFITAAVAAVGNKSGEAHPPEETPKNGAQSPGIGSGQKRVLFWAVDAMDPAMLARFEPDLPNLRRMQTEGFSGRILPYPSCWVNIDFMSMLTGAPPGTQYRSRLPDGRSPRHKDCVSETIWEALESEGRRSFLLDFPGSAPSKFVATIPGSKPATISSAVIYQTRDVQLPRFSARGLETTGWPPGGGPRPGRHPVVVQDAKPPAGWGSLPPSAMPPLEITLPSRWLGLIVASGARGYDTVLLFETRNGPLLTQLRIGAWLPWRPVAQGTVRFRLLDLKPDGSGLQLLQSAICTRDDFSEPADLSRALVQKLGPYSTASAIPPDPLDPFCHVGQEEAMEGAMWAAKAAMQSLDDWDWHFFLHKTELVDEAMHQCLTLADPTYHSYDPRTAAKAEAVLRQAYVNLDRVVGVLLDGLASRLDTVLVVASDHGGGVNNTVCDVNQRLRDAGLLVDTDGTIDWSRTGAYTKRDRQGTEIYVNLVGREPHGIVSAVDFEHIQDLIIDALLDWRDPTTRKRAVAYALKLRDAALIGYWGAEAGDVHFAYNPGFVWGSRPGAPSIFASQSPIANHGPQIVTGSTGYSSLMGTLLAWGPGITRNAARDESRLGPIPIAAVAPTVSHLLDCAPPRDCTFAPVREMLAR